VLSHKHIGNILTNRYYTGVVFYKGIEYCGQPTSV
jgi:hypothetical protein